MRVPREWVWVVILVAVLAIALLGCASPTKQPGQKSDRSDLHEQRERSRELKESDRSEFTSWMLDYGLYAFTYEGHLYFWELDGFVIHAASCKGVHYLVGP